MRQTQSYGYLLIEDSYLISQSLTRMMADLRPSWRRVGVCDSVNKIKDGILANPDFILADSHLSDGTSIIHLKQHASNHPIVLYTHQICEDEACRTLSNIVKFIYEPVSHEELEEAVGILESSYYRNV